MQYFWLILIGVTAGRFAGQLMTGKGFGVMVDLAAGAIGAVTGGVLFEQSGMVAERGFIGSLAVAAAGAVVCLYGVRMVKKWRA